MKTKPATIPRAAKRRHLLSALLLALIALLSLPGMAVSAYLTYGYFAESSLFCELGHACDAVRDSEYSAIFGVPVALLGILIYVAIFATAAVGAWRPGSLRDLTALGVFGMGFFGTVYSAYLTWLELYRIEAVCMWCTISALLVTAILVISVGNLLLRGGSGAAEGGQPGRSSAEAHGWPTDLSDE